MRASKLVEPAPRNATQQVFDIHSVPGHLIRRAQQIAVAIFVEETAETDLTPIQFALLAELERASGVDQVTLAALIAVDVATFGQVVTRLEERGLVVRESDPVDRRRKRLALTSAGRSCLKRAIPAVRSAQARILAPLDAIEQAELCRLLAKLVEQNNDASRAPMRRVTG
ncbi:MAG: MarR family transcriptional regulator [Burkholderiales bacterium]|nr:MAG: MarR family transcriptional regulator [Burkholderiales bacterium]TAG79105.1 MAG: MarR family transcriptional regulator [Betaproteobacteria bacterium]